MRKILFTVLALCLGFQGSIIGQNTNGVKPNAFKPGWKVGANLGWNMFMGEGNNFLNPNKPYVFDFAGNSGLQGRLSAAYNFNPVIGVKGMLGYHGYKWSTVPQNTDGTYPYVNFGSENLTADFMLNLSNWWAGFNPQRKFDVSAFVGAGAAVLNNNAALSPWGFLGRAGLQADYHLTPEFDINMIVEGNATSDNYNDVANKPLVIDAIPAITLGIAYRLPAKEKKPAKKVAEEIKVVDDNAGKDMVVENKKDTVEKIDIKKDVEVKDQIADTKETVTDKAVETTPVTNSGILNEKIFFTLNSAYISEMTNKAAIREIADYVKAHPEAIITVSGYADKATGSVDANNMMSKMRAVNVANTLIRYYGVSYKNIVVKWYGASVQPYRVPAKNRLVMVKSPGTKNGQSIVSPAKNDKAQETIIPDKPVVGDQKKKSDTTAVATYDIFTTVNFTDNSFEINTEKQEAAIMKVALYLRKFPKTKILISGYADKSTGSTDKNNELSKKRAINVANALIQRYSINYDRIQTKWFGGEKQAYTTPSMNRLVLIETLK